jgi:hypothetical protein
MRVNLWKKVKLTSACLALSLVSEHYPLQYGNTILVVVILLKDFYARWKWEVFRKYRCTKEKK